MSTTGTGLEQAFSAGPSLAARAAVSRSTVQRRLIVGTALLVLGAAAGIGAAWWQRTAAPVSLAAPAGAVVAGTTAGVGDAVVATAGRPAEAPPRPRSTGAGLVQRDAAEMLGAGPTTEWRLARLRGNPQVLVLEFPDLAEQGAAMNRAAAFIEKAEAPRDRVLSDAELSRLIARQGDNEQTFYQGHDYVGDQLARFYTVAAAQRQPLNVHEQRLLQLLLDKRVLTREGSSYVAQGLQAIVTFTGTQGDDARTPQDEAVDSRRRESVLLHELSHGLFFTSAAYREHCWRFWRERMTADERARFRRMLAQMNYDAANEALLVNEMQALLMHTPDTRAFSAASLGLTEAQLADMRARFRRGMPER